MIKSQPVNQTSQLIKPNENRVKNEQTQKHNDDKINQIRN